jgi:electron transport complex protein RnfD
MTALLRQSSPHLRGPGRTGAVMRLVMLATAPGLLMLVVHFGWGPAINVLLAAGTACLAEALILALRRRPIATVLRDSSALLTGVLLGLALPPFLPWWMTVLGSAFAIVFGKQLYGGIGHNPFNPAMVGYVVLLISFPLAMTTWALPAGLTEQGAASPVAAAEAIFAASDGAIDAYTGATPLDDFKHRRGLTSEEWAEQSGLDGLLGGRGWEWVNLAFLAGGLYLIRRGLFSWHAPGGMLATLGILAILFWDTGSSEGHGGPLFHLFSGATMFGAFFILTDPVSSATSPRGRLVFGIGAGILLFVIRAWGSYPDAIAFAVLLMNLAAPLIDRYTRPRAYGHARTLRGSTPS